MTELEQNQLNEMLSSHVMQKALQAAIHHKKKSDVDTIEKAALAQAFNMGLLAGLNSLLESAKVKTTLGLTTRKLKHD
jgi:regulator of RNase E activity RraB